MKPARSLPWIQEAARLVVLGLIYAVGGLLALCAIAVCRACYLAVPLLRRLLAALLLLGYTPRPIDGRLYHFIHSTLK